MHIDNMKFIGQYIQSFEGSPDSDTFLALKSGKVVRTAGSTGGSINVQEIDGTPSVTSVTTLKVTNGTLTDNTGGVVTIDTGGASAVNDLSDANTSGVAANDILV